MSQFPAFSMASTNTNTTTSSSPTTTSAAEPQQPPPGLTGSCLCGQITYALAAGAAPLANVICYCANCSKQTGTGLQASSAYAVDAFRITSATRPRRYTDEAVASGHPLWRHFCDRCGSPVYAVSSRPEGRGFVSVAVGTLDRGEGGGKDKGEGEGGKEGEGKDWRGWWTPNMVVRAEERPAWLEGVEVVSRNRLEGTA